MTRVLHIPARSREIALKVAYAIEAGRIVCLEQYLDEDRAKRSAQALTALHHDRHEAFCIVLETRTVDDGRIPVARVIDGIGSLAAALMIVVVGSYVVGIGSII